MKTARIIIRRLLILLFFFVINLLILPVTFSVGVICLLLGKDELGEKIVNYSYDLCEEIIDKYASFD